MKYNRIFYILIASLLFWSCGSDGESDTEFSEVDKTEYRIVGELNTCSGDSIYLWEVEGQELKNVNGTKLESEESTCKFVLEGKLKRQGLYFIGLSPQNGTLIMLGGERNIKFNAQAVDIRNTMKITDSPLNKEYLEFMEKATQYKQDLSTLQQQAAGGQQGALIEMDKKLKEYQNFLSETGKKKSLIGLIAKVMIEPNPPANLNKEEQLNYYVDNFFKPLDLSDERLAYIPDFWGRLMYFSNIIGSTQSDNDEAVGKLQNVVKQMKSDKLKQLAYMSMLNGTQNSNPDLFVKLANKFSEKFPTHPMAPSYLAVAKSFKGLMIGSEAPEIVSKNPQGQVVKLSDYRGKVVLLDFWASWCKPCRAENPNVKNAYAKYKAKGFEVFGVSLDETKEAWTKAIAQDGISWIQVSDIQGWKCAAAQDYNVNSIPNTFLLDKEGKIIAKNLRGPQLEAKLKEIFGS